MQTRAWVDLALALAAGLALFLHGVGLLADGLRAAAGDRVKQLLARFTTNRVAGVVAGTAATTLLDSSSVTIILVIALVDAGALAFTSALGVVLGANVGTTLSSQLFASDADRWSPAALAAGLALRALGRSDRARDVGTVVLGLGLVLFGLHTMGDAVEPLRGYRPFLALMERMRHPLLGALVGAGVTAVIQSSSATVGVVVTLAGQGLITLPAGVALMLGAEVGTCADTLLATLGRSRAAVRTGVFHLLFNVATVAAGVALATPLADAAAWATRATGGSGVARQIANAHLLFNGLGVLLVLGFLPAVARALTRALPDRPAGARP